jgi:hypothetical protein
VDHRTECASIAQEFFLRHGIPPVKPTPTPDPWMAPVLQAMTRGVLGSGACDHCAVLTNGYLGVLMAAACRIVDNVAAVEFARWAADDLIREYLSYCERRGQIANAPASMEAQRTAIVQVAVSAICCSKLYPDFLPKCLEPFLENRPKFRIGTNADSLDLFPASFEFGLPSTHLTPVAPREEQVDITDASPQFQLFFQGCRGSLRRGFALNPSTLELMQELRREEGPRRRIFDAIQQMGAFAPRPKHDYATAGEYILVTMVGVAAFNACMFAKVRFDPPMVYPDWASWSMHFGSEDEAGHALVGMDAIAALGSFPATLPTTPKQELELWLPQEFPTWVSHQASWSARRGKPVQPRHYQTLSLERYLA